MERLAQLVPFLSRCRNKKLALWTPPYICVVAFLSLLQPEP
jgi:hypothetical protein